MAPNRSFPSGLLAPGPLHTPHTTARDGASEKPGELLLERAVRAQTHRGGGATFVPSPLHQAVYPHPTPPATPAAPNQGSHTAPEQGGGTPKLVQVQLRMVEAALMLGHSQEGCFGADPSPSDSYRPLTLTISTSRGEALSPQARFPRQSSLQGSPRQQRRQEFGPGALAATGKRARKLEIMRCHRRGCF